MNKVFLIGNLTRDPELSTTGSGVKYCRFTLAVSRSYAKDGKRETDLAVPSRQELSTPPTAAVAM